jgi:hypothetical protein
VVLLPPYTFGSTQVRKHIHHKEYGEMRRDKEVPIVRSLEEVGPVARVWVVANSMPGATRAEVLEACKKLRINQNTASTQYQLWSYARRQARVARTLPKTLKKKIVRDAEVELRA